MESIAVQKYAISATRTNKTYSVASAAMGQAGAPVRYAFLPVFHHIKQQQLSDQTGIPLFSYSTNRYNTFISSVFLWYFFGISLDKTKEIPKKYQRNTNE